MDVKTLEALGISPEDLGERIVDQAVNALLTTSGFDPDTDTETSYESRFKEKVKASIQKSVDAKIAFLAETHIVPRVGELIEQADMRKTNSYGEPKSPPMTFKEYLAHRAEVYMTDDVDSLGRSKEEASAKGDGYNWRSSGPRLTVLMKMYIKESMEKAASAAVSDINKTIAKNIEAAAKNAISAAASSLSVSVAVK